MKKVFVIAVCAFALVSLYSCKGSCPKFKFDPAKLTRVF